MEHHPYRMIVAGISGSNPDLVAVTAAQLKWAEVHLISDRDGALSQVPGIIRHRTDDAESIRVAMDNNLLKPESLVIFEECHSKLCMAVMMEFFIRSRLKGIRVICVDLSLRDIHRAVRKHTDCLITTSSPNISHHTHIHHIPLHIELATKPNGHTE